MSIQTSPGDAIHQETTSKFIKISYQINDIM